MHRLATTQSVTDRHTTYW